MLCGHGSTPRRNGGALRPRAAVMECSGMCGAWALLEADIPSASRAQQRMIQVFDCSQPTRTVLVSRSSSDCRTVEVRPPPKQRGVHAFVRSDPDLVHIRVP